MGDEVGRAATYAELRKLIKMRRQEMRLSQEALNHIAGLQSGYINKLECGDRCFGDMSLDAVLGALGAELALMRSRAPHNAVTQAFQAIARNGLKNIHALNGSKGGKKCQGRRTAEERTKAARKAAGQRWRKERLKRAAAAAALLVAQAAAAKKRDAKPGSA